MVAHGHRELAEGAEHVHAAGVEAGLLDRLAEGSRDGAGVPGVDPPAGKRDLAGVMGQSRGPPDQQHVEVGRHGSARVVRRQRVEHAEEHEDRGGATRVPATPDPRVVRVPRDAAVDERGELGAHRYAHRCARRHSVPPARHHPREPGHQPMGSGRPSS